jgi:hypothetical protein
MLDELDSECCPLCLVPLHTHTEDATDQMSSGSGGVAAGPDEETEADSLVVTTLCNHRFHLGCLRRSRQIATQGDSCPMCRQPLAAGLTPRGRAKWAQSLSGSSFTTRRTTRSNAPPRSRARVRPSSFSGAGAGASWSGSSTYGASLGARATRTSSTAAATSRNWRQHHQPLSSSTTAAAAGPLAASLRHTQAPVPPQRNFLRQHTFDASLLGGA